MPEIHIRYSDASGGLPHATLAELARIASEELDVTAVEWHRNPPGQVTHQNRPGGSTEADLRGQEGRTR